MATTDAYGQSGLALAGSAETEFVHGPQVDSDIVVEWDLDGDGDFDSDEEDVTSYLYEAESFTGRNWPSQLQGKAGPGTLRMTLRNDDDRFSYFNADSPLNQGGRTLDPGRKLRIRTSDATDVDPVLLARDRFTGGLETITTDELGNTWTHRTPYNWVVVSDVAQHVNSGQEVLMTLDAGAADYYVQITIAEAGDNVKATAGLQENNYVRLIYRYQDDSNYSYVSWAPSDNTGVHVIEGVDVVAGVATSIYGPFRDLDFDDDSAGDHRRRVTIGVHAVGTAVDYYINGTLRNSVSETGLQTDETEVGISAYYGIGNEAPAVDEFAVWDRFPSDTDGVLWTGYVTDVFPEAAPGAPKVVTVTAEGPLAQLAQATIQPEPYAGQLRTGTAIGDAVEKAGLLYPPGVLARGTVTAGSSSSVEINALAHARKFEEVEFGFLHEAPEGWLVFRDRSYRSGLTTSATFSDVEGAQHNYQTFELLQWRRELINRVTAGVSYGGPNLPVVGGISKAGTASGVARTITWTFPASVEDGDLFVLIITSTIANNNENWLVPLWWVRNRDTGASSSKRTQVYTHIAAASEASSTVTFYNDAAAAGGSFIIGYYQIRDWYGTHEGIAIGPWAVGESFAGADPQAILPPWGDTNPTAFIAQRAGTSTGGAGSVSNSVFPLGYANGTDSFQNGSGSDIHDCGIQLCQKVAMSAVEDASSFTGFSGLNNAETSVIAIRGKNGSPPEPRGRFRVTVEDTDSQTKHNTVASYDACDLFPNESEAADWCDLMLTTYAQLRPIVRISFTATVSSTYRRQAYLRRLGDKIRVVATQGTGMGIDADFHIESIRHRWSHGGKLWTTAWELSPA